MGELEGDLKTIKLIDQIISTKGTILKDSSGNGSKVYTKLYQIITKHPGAKVVRVRIWFNETTNKGTVKIRGIPYALLTGVSAYTLVQTGLFVQEALTKWVGH